MAKIITIKLKDGQEYKLEFTRRVVRAMIDNGFEVDDLKGAKAILALPELFENAFVANHPRMKKSEIKEIYKSLPDKISLVTELINMFVEPMNALFDEIAEEPEDGSGNAVWEVSE